MGNSGYYKSWALGALNGKWDVAILAGIIASFLGGAVTGASSGVEIDLEGQDIGFGVLISFLGFALIYGITLLIIGGAVKLGYARFNLTLVDGGDVSARMLFSQFHLIGEGFLMNLLIGIYTMLWSMLFVIPGIIKSYSYAMTPYILHEFPFMSPNEAITESRRLMDGNKWDLFLLDLSFIGWGLLCAIPSVIAAIIIQVNIGTFFGSVTGLSWLLLLSLAGNAGRIFLLPYKEAAYAAFYCDITANRVNEMN